MPDQFEHGYGLLIGVDESYLEAWALPEVAQDVTALRDVLVHPQRCAYPPHHVLTLTGQGATRQGILDGLEWLQKQVEADGSDNTTAVVYFSGHGLVEGTPPEDHFYLVPYDIREQRVAARSLRAEDVAAEIEALTPRRLLVILDCCHAGGMGVKGAGALALPAGWASAVPPASLFLGGGKGSAIGAEAAAKGAPAEVLSQGSGRAVFCSSTGGQQSYVRRDRTMSIFTYHLKEALTGHAEPKEGATEVLVTDVMGHLWRRVPQSAQADWKKEQNPDCQTTGMFPVALLLGGEGLSKGQPAPDPLAPLPEIPPPGGATTTYHAEVHGSGVVAQGPGAQAVGERATIVRDVHGSIITGDHDRIEQK